MFNKHYLFLNTERKKLLHGICYCIFHSSSDSVIFICYVLLEILYFSLALYRPNVRVGKYFLEGPLVTSWIFFG